jgi:hypothetical protein
VGAGVRAGSRLSKERNYRPPCGEFMSEAKRSQPESAVTNTPAKTELVPIFAEQFLLVLVFAEQFFAILNKADQHYDR